MGHKLDPSQYDGLFVSNGPGDPVKCKKVVDNMRSIIEDKTNIKPVFGICLGHQLLSTAAGCNLQNKGILSEVEFNSKILDGKWKITGFPLETFDTSAARSQSNAQRPTFYEGDFTLPAGGEPLDTFVDTTGWGKGYVWVNRHNLGRYWPSAGPQITLYLPGLWLKPAPEKNHIQILELNKPPHVVSIDLVDYPILNRTGNINCCRYQPTPT